MNIALNSAQEYMLNNNTDFNDSASAVSGDSDNVTITGRSEIGSPDDRRSTRMAFNTLYEPYQEFDVEPVNARRK